MNEKPIKASLITPEKAVEILRKSNMVVSVESAKEILNLLRLLAKAEIDEYLNNEDS